MCGIINCLCIRSAGIRHKPHNVSVRFSVRLTGWAFMVPRPLQFSAQGDVRRHCIVASIDKEGEGREERGGWLKRICRRSFPTVRACVTSLRAACSTNLLPPPSPAHPIERTLFGFRHLFLVSFLAREGQVPPSRFRGRVKSRDCRYAREGLTDSRLYASRGRSCLLSLITTNGSHSK